MILPTSAEYNVNRISPRTDPWDTPHITCHGSIDFESRCIIMYGPKGIIKTNLARCPRIWMIRTIGTARFHGQQCHMLAIYQVETAVHNVIYRKHWPDQRKVWGRQSISVDNFCMQTKILVNNCTWLDGVQLGGERSVPAALIEMIDWWVDGR